MPTIKLSNETKLQLDSLMAAKLQSKMENKKPSKRKELAFQIIKNRNRIGITYDSFVSELMNRYTKSTK